MRRRRATRTLAMIALAGSVAAGGTTIYVAAHGAGVSARVTASSAGAAATPTPQAGSAPGGGPASGTPAAGAPPSGTPPVGGTSGPPPAGGPPSGTPPAGGPSGAPPAGGAPGPSSQKQLGTASYTVKSGSIDRASQRFRASGSDESAILVTNGGTLRLTKASITTTGASSSSDSSSFYGLNAGVLAYSSGDVALSGSSISTSGAGANGLFAYGSKASVTMSGGSITATGQYAHGVMASGGGTVTISNVSIETAGNSSAAVATDRGGGTITVKGGTMTTSGAGSPGIYSTGTITASNAKMIATGSEAAVIEGSNAIYLTNTDLTGSKLWGVMIYQSFSGDAQGGHGVFTMSGGSLTALSGPLFHVTNSTGTIVLKNVKIDVPSGILVDASADRWGTTGSNGGTANLTADHQTLKGNIVADRYSAVSITLKDGSTLTGAINTGKTASSASLTLDASSRWKVTANSTLSSLAGAHVSRGLRSRTLWATGTR